MSDKKRSAMKKWKRTLIATALTASMILALPVWNVGRAQAAPNTANGSCKLTVQHADSDANKLNVVIDLYKVASVDTSFTGYDAYKLNLETAYKTADVEDKDGNVIKGTETIFKEAQNPGEGQSSNALYQEMAQKVAEIALGQKEGSTAQATSLHATFGGDGKKSATFENLDPGMYLIVAHGEELTDIKDYVTKVKDDKENEKLATIAYNNQYVYTYSPELISLPMRATENGGVPEGSFGTAERTEWLNEVTVNIKTEEALRHASLEIIKNLDKAPLTDDSCVFEITAEWNGAVYHSFKSVSFGENDGTSKTIKLEGLIPVGAEVTVTEVFSGASYTISETTARTQTINGAQADTVDEETGVITINNRVTFTNTRTDSGAGSGAITNNFKYSDTDGWGGSNDRGESLGTPSDTPNT